jgi:flagellar biosynthesis protein
MSTDPPKTPYTAVALRYEGRGAPRVTAKGKGVVAEQILSAAKTHSIPVQEDAELAALLSGIALGDEIPPELYLVVAELLAFAYRLCGRLPSQHDLLQEGSQSLQKGKGTRQGG